MIGGRQQQETLDIFRRLSDRELQLIHEWFMDVAKDAVRDGLLSYAETTLEEREREGFYKAYEIAMESLKTEEGNYEI